MIDLLIPLAANGGAPVQTPSIFSPVSTPAIAIREIAFLQPPRDRESRPGRSGMLCGHTGSVNRQVDSLGHQE